MFDNIGGKCKGLAKVLCWLGIIGSIIVAVSYWVAASNAYRSDTTGLVITGFIWLLAGDLGSWIGSWMLYAVGEAEEKAEKAYQQAMVNTKYIHILISNRYENTNTEQLSNTDKISNIDEKRGIEAKLNEEIKWCCPKCFAKNDMESNVCSNCKSVFEFKPIK